MSKFNKTAISSIGLLSVPNHNHPNQFGIFNLMCDIDISGSGSSFYGEKGKVNLVNTLFDLFLAGSETTSTTLTWAMLYMAR